MNTSLCGDSHSLCAHDAYSVSLAARYIKILFLLTANDSDRMNQLLDQHNLVILKSISSACLLLPGMMNDAHKCPNPQIHS